MLLLHHYLRDSAARFGGKPALIVGTQSHSFAEIDRCSDQLACALQRVGVRRGDRVGVMLENSAEMVIGLWAALKAGAVFIPINHATKADKLAFLLEDSGAAVLVAPTSLRQRVRSATADLATLKDIIWAGEAPGPGALHLSAILAGPHDAPQDPQLIDQDLCLIIYTSGSTGKPKGVMMSHRNICHNVWSISIYLGNVPEDVVLCALPLSFDYGLFQVLTGARIGFTVVLERSFTFPADVLKRIGEHKVTGLPGVPTIFATMLQLAPFDGLDLSSLRYLTNTAASLPPAHIRRLRRLLPQATIFSMFGLTECTRVGYLDPGKIDRKPTSVGRAMPNTEAYVVDDDGRRLGPDAIGELVVRGASVMRGYWRSPEETAQALRDGDIPGEKVLHTGDLFRMDADGDLYFVGRKDDVFKCRGEKVSPKEVENVLYELEAVGEAAVIGVADDIDGAAVKVFVRIRDGHRLTEQAVRQHCRSRLEPQLVPRYVEFRAELPKTDSGKITKTPLRAAGATAP